jgi:hypothetical protein
MVRFLSIRNPVRLVAWQGPRNNILCQAVTKGRPSAYPWRWQDARDEEDCPMASLFTDDDRLKKPSMHEIGQDLALLSVKESMSASRFCRPRFRVLRMRACARMPRRLPLMRFSAK